MSAFYYEQVWLAEWKENVLTQLEGIDVIVTKGLNKEK